MNKKRPYNHKKSLTQRLSEQREREKDGIRNKALSIVIQKLHETGGDRGKAAALLLIDINALYNQNLLLPSNETSKLITLLSAFYRKLMEVQ